MAAIMQVASTTMRCSRTEGDSWILVNSAKDEYTATRASMGKSIQRGRRSSQIMTKTCNTPVTAEIAIKPVSGYDREDSASMKKGTPASTKKTAEKSFAARRRGRSRQ